MLRMRTRCSHLECPLAAWGENLHNSVRGIPLQREVGEVSHGANTLAVVPDQQNRWKHSHSDEDRHGIDDGNNEDGEDDFQKWTMTKKTTLRTMGPKDVVDVDYDSVEKPAETQTSLHSFTG